MYNQNTISFENKKKRKRKKYLFVAQIRRKKMFNNSLKDWDFNLGPESEEETPFDSAGFLMFKGDLRRFVKLSMFYDPDRLKRRVQELINEEIELMRYAEDHFNMSADKFISMQQKLKATIEKDNYRITDYFSPSHDSATSTPRASPKSNLAIGANCGSESAEEEEYGDIDDDSRVSRVSFIHF